MRSDVPGEYPCVYIRTQTHTHASSEYTHMYARARTCGRAPAQVRVGISLCNPSVLRHRPIAVLKPTLKARWYTLCVCVFMCVYHLFLQRLLQYREQP